MSNENKEFDEFHCFRPLTSEELGMIQEGETLTVYSCYSGYQGATTTEGKEFERTKDGRWLYLDVKNMRANYYTTKYVLAYMRAFFKSIKANEKFVIEVVESFNPIIKHRKFPLTN